MRRPIRLAILAIALAAAAAGIWILGGFLWPRPQFENPGAPWVVDSAREGER